MDPRIEAMKRQASLAEIGGFRPPDEPASSWFGRVNLAAEGEGWPRSGGESMLPLAQINLAETPVVPPPLDGLALATLFVRRDLPTGQPENGQGWCLRTYPDLERLQHLEEVSDLPQPAERPAPFPMRWSKVEEYPTRDDVPVELLDAWAEGLGDGDAGVAAAGFKVGGWPMNIQGAIDWSPNSPGNPRPDEFRFTIQVDTTEKGRFSVGQCGALYVGHRALDDSWHLAWETM